MRDRGVHQLGTHPGEGSLLLPLVPVVLLLIWALVRAAL